MRSRLWVAMFVGEQHAFRLEIPELFIHGCTAIMCSEMLPPANVYQFFIRMSSDQIPYSPAHMLFALNNC